MARPGRGRPNRPVIVTGHPLGLPAQPTPLHPVRVVTKTARRAGRAIVTHGANVLGNKAAATPLVHAARIVTGGARRGTGRIVLAHGVMAATVVAPPAHPAQVHTQTARRPGHVIVVRSPSLANATPRPHVLSASTRRPGRTIVWRNPGAVGIPAQATPKPKVVATATRRAGRIVVLGRHGSFVVVPVAGRQPQVHTASTRKAGRVIVLQAKGGVTGPPTPGPILGMVLSNTTLILTVPAPPTAPTSSPKPPTVLGPSQMVIGP